MKKKFLAFALAASMTVLMTATAFAAEAAPEDEAVEDQGPVDTSSPTPANVGKAAAVAIVNNQQDASMEYTEGAEVDGDVTDTSFSGSISADTYFATGIIISGSDYTVSNADITMGTTASDNDEIEPGLGIDVGSGIAVRDGSFVTIEDSTIQSDGAWGSMDYVRAAVVVGWQTIDDDDIVVIRNTTMDNNGNDENTTNVGYFPGAGGDFNILKNLTVSGNGRTFVALGNSKSYLYNDEITGTGWAAICTDMATDNGLYVYSVGTTGLTTVGGYGVYSDTNCYDYFYNSTLQGADFGCIISNDGALVMTTLSDDAADRDDIENDALEYATDDDIATASAKASVVSGGRNAVMTHATDPNYIGVIDLTNTSLVTSLDYIGTTEDIEYMAGFEPFLQVCDGADILAKTSSLDISLVNCDASSYTDTLVLAVVDSDNGGISDDVDAAPNTVYLENVTSDSAMDIYNYDYQRGMEVTVADMTFSAAMDYMTYDEYLETPYLDGIQELAGTENKVYLSLTVDDGATWEVTGNSRLTTLTIAEGGDISSASGELTVTVDGEEVTVEPGNTYEGDIVITIF